MKLFCPICLTSHPKSSCQYNGTDANPLINYRKSSALGGGAQAVALTDEDCAFLVAVIARDLGLQSHFPEAREDLPAFFSSEPLEHLRLQNTDFLALFERILTHDPNVDTYFSCLARLHKSRLKYEVILRTQPIPSIEQVGPRGLLQFGRMGQRALVAFLFWRKWIYDIDNRAGQETGYLFEPIIAHSIGGVAASSASSPVRRRSDKNKGRQVDCIRQNKAYEFKLRVTIAASGQGRWQEELEFPEDCQASDYTPVLIVLDPTPNPKLDELVKAFLGSDGEVYVGNAAWNHLQEAAPAWGSVQFRCIEVL